MCALVLSEPVVRSMVQLLIPQNLILTGLTAKWTSQMVWTSWGRKKEIPSMQPVDSH